MFYLAVLLNHRVDDAIIWDLLLNHLRILSKLNWIDSQCHLMIKYTQQNYNEPRAETKQNMKLFLWLYINKLKLPFFHDHYWPNMDRGRNTRNVRLNSRPKIANTSSYLVTLHIAMKSKNIESCILGYLSFHIFSDFKGVIPSAESSQHGPCDT